MVRSGIIGLLLVSCASENPVLGERTRSGPQVPLDLWPRVLAHAAAEEMRPPERRCESETRDQDWLDLTERLRSEDRALRGGPPVEGGARSDAEITARLHSVLAERGWPDPCDLGDRAAKQLWFVVQHSPDSALLRQDIDFFEEAAAYGFTPYSQVATMRDRILMQAGEDQMYGTQYVCDDDTGRRVRWRVADAAGLDERRRRVGLIPAKWELRIMNHGRGPCGQR